GFDVEEQKPALGGASRNAVAEGFANFVAGFADTGKNNFPARNSEMSQMFKFTTGDHVKTTADFCELLEDRKISVGFNRKTKSMRQRGETFVELAKGGLYGGLAVNVCGRGKSFCGGGE